MSARAMATVLYSVCGEGRGHATRVRAVVDELRRRHRVVLLAADEAHELLAAAYRASDVQVLRIPGLRFHYTGRGAVAKIATAVHAGAFVRRMSGEVTAVRRLIERLAPDLAITDFEPLLPRAAEASGLPYVSLDHQHLLVVGELRSLPGPLCRRAAAMRPIVRAYHRRQRHTIVSSFHHLPLRSGVRRVTLVGVLLRRSILAAEPAAGDHLVAYIRRHAPRSLLGALAACGREVRLYGLGARPPHGRLRFRPVSEDGFTADLSGCAALLTTAGNQVVGEALHLRKPVLALPEEGNFEQRVNGHLLELTGAGCTHSPRAVTEDALRRFLDRLEPMRRAADRLVVAGNRAALDAIHRHLPSDDRGDDRGPLTTATYNARQSRLPNSAPMAAPAATSDG